MPLTTGDQFAQALRQLDTSSAESVRNVQGLGRVAVTQQIAQTQRMTETVSEYSIDKPNPPVVPPGAPACTSDDTTNTFNCGSLDPATLEMSLDSGASWVPLVTTGHTGNKSVQVRVKANGATAASPTTTLIFTETTTGPDTTAPTQTSPTNLGTFTLGSSLTQTLVFDEDIATATIGSLPTGVTATRTISGKTVSVTLTVNPLTFVFSSVTQSIPFTLTVTDAANNTRATSETASATDVAPNTPGLSSVTRGDFG